MFFGEYEHSLDQKNRLILPARFRDNLLLSQKSKEKCILFMTRGFDTCLAFYTEISWKAELGYLQETSYLKTSSRNFQRLLYSRTMQVTCDGQGRLLIPEKFKKEAQINRDVTFVGLDQKFEIWDRQRWQNFNEDNHETFEKLAESLVESSSNSSTAKDESNV